MSKLTHQRGTALAVSLLLLALLMMLGISAMYSNIVQGRMATNYESGVQAFNLAEAGIADALNRLNTGGATNGFTDELTTNSGTMVTINFGTGNYTVRALDNDDGDSNPNADADGRITLQSAATVRGAKRTVELVVRLSPGPPATATPLAWRQITP